MTVHELHDAIGLLEEELLEETDRLRTAPRKRVLPLRRYWAAAACLVMLLGGTFAFWFVNNALRCGSAAPALFSAKSSPIMENAAEAQRAAEDSAAPEDTAENQSPAASAAKTESAEDGAASGGIGMDRGELAQPPALVIDSLTVTSGNYTWTVHQDDNTAQTVMACGAHPMDYIGSLPMLSADTQRVALEWAVAPVSVTVRCWQVGQGQEEQEAELDGNTLSLQPGDWVYEVNAEFDQGQASYAFRAVWE